MDRYYFFARLCPATITAIPFIILVVYTAGNQYTEAAGHVWRAAAKFSHIVPSAAIIFLMIQVNRLVSKELFQKLYFQDELDMPTTRYLLPSSAHFTPQVYAKLQACIHRDFDLALPTIEEEQQSNVLARKQIVACVTLIRGLLRDDRLLLKHNIEYGFFRNLLGGAAVGLLACFFGLIIFHFIKPVSIAFWLNMIAGAFYLLLLLVSRYVLNRFGNYYANILFAQYLTRTRQTVSQ